MRRRRRAAVIPGLALRKDGARRDARRGRQSPRARCYRKSDRVGVRDNSSKVAPACAPPNFRVLDQRIDYGLHAALDIFGSPRRPLADVVENGRQLGGGSLRETKFHKPCFAQMARISCSGANSPRSACAKDSSNEDLRQALVESAVAPHPQRGAKPADRFRPVRRAAVSGPIRWLARKALSCRHHKPTSGLQEAALTSRS
jgi:hypothetical protein